VNADPARSGRPSFSRQIFQGRGWMIAGPYLWLLLFFLLPFLIVLAISFSESIIGVPPYAPIAEFVEDRFVQIRLNLGNYAYLFSDEIYVRAYLNSIRFALSATVLCLLLGYPMAYAIARAPRATRHGLLMLVVLPFWTSFLIRVYAWIGILNTNGSLNGLLIGLGIIDEPLALLNTPFSVTLGLVYSYLPFMILPLYATLEKMDEALLEAAMDLGCRPWRAFLQVTLPLSLPGVAAGSLLVFIPAVGEFVIPDLLGGPETMMIGKVLWDEFFSNRDWPVASAVAIAMLVLIVGPIMIFQRFERRS
jgi:putrescine transport system permease protein